MSKNVLIKTAIFVVALAAAAVIFITHIDDKHLDTSLTVDQKYVNLVIGHHTRSIVTCVNRFNVSSKAKTSILEAISSCQSVSRGKDQLRSKSWVSHIRESLSTACEGKILTEDYASCALHAVTPMIEYLDEVEKAHPDWDASELDRSFFNTFR